MGKLYTVLRDAVRTLGPKMQTEWAVDFDGEPSVFCPNHAGAFGPIDMCAHFPLSDHCHPWLNAAVMDPKQVPAYVRQDYWWEPGCFFEPLLNVTLPYMAARRTAADSAQRAGRACLPRHASNQNLPQKHRVPAPGRALDYFSPAAVRLPVPPYGAEPWLFANRAHGVPDASASAEILSGAYRL